MLVTIFNQSDFAAYKAQPPIDMQVDASDNSDNFYYLVDKESGELTLILHHESGDMTQKDLHTLRMDVAKAAAATKPGLAEKVIGMTVNSPDLTAHSIQAVGVPSVKADGLFLKARVNMFQVYQSANFLNDDGSYVWANFNVFIPKSAVNELGQTYLSTSFMQIEQWFNNAAAAECVDSKGNVIISFKDEAGKNVYSGHSNQYFGLDLGSYISFSIMQKGDGSYLMETINVDGRDSKGLKCINSEAYGDFSIIAIAGGVALLNSNFKPEERKVLDRFKRPATPAIQHTPAAGGNVNPPTPGALPGDIANQLNGNRKKPVM